MNRRPERDPYGGRSPREIPAYSAFEASHYLRVPETTIRNWAGRAKPLIEIADERQHLFSFINLLELHVISALRRDHHVQMQKIRRAIEYLQAELNSRHPLIDEEMETDGTDIFVSKYGSLINRSRDGQLAMKALLQAHLKRIERDERGVAIRLFPFTRRRDAGTTLDALRLIAIDPAVAFGRPVIVGSRVPTSEIAERFQAGESPSELAEDFGRTEEEIWEAIRCELQTAA
ncbi:MAG: hypothetical protein AUF76_09785 [Acidobacteria bacterium 13_1_20CM_2_65_9]|nr:MAG: hypothetical protein AUF76_09785 [Acidobacteria bacterium 13_1_20CM_2_65_9]